MELFWIISGFTLLGVFGFGLQILAIRSSVKSNAQPASGQDFRTFCPPISILKPLSGLDDGLFDNLMSFCQQEYPKFEILFSLQNSNDPAYRVAQKIKDKFPDRDISLIVEECNEGWNPKVNNLIPALRKARYPYLLISDSNVRVDKDYLRKTVQPMRDRKIGLVTNLIRGVGGRTIGSLFENLHLNSFVIGNVCLLQRYLNIPCVIGKSMLMRKEDLEAIGGLKAVKDVLAEDHFIGEKIKERGQKVIVSSHLINNVNEYWGVKRFFNRHLRWGKMRWKILGYKYLSELIGNPVLFSFFPLLFEGPTRRAILLMLSISFIKGAGDYYIGKKIEGSLHPLTYCLAPVKDLLIGLLWFLSIVNNTVVWRGNRLMIGENTLLSSYPSRGVWTWRYRLWNRVALRSM